MITPKQNKRTTLILVLVSGGLISLALGYLIVSSVNSGEALEYFRKARHSLLPGGVFFVDIFGGTVETIDEGER